MLNIILSHWTIYVYMAYVLVLIVLFIVHRPRVNAFDGKRRPFRPRAMKMTPRLNVRQFH